MQGAFGFVRPSAHTCPAPGCLVRCACILIVYSHRRKVCDVQAFVVRKTRQTHQPGKEPKMRGAAAAPERRVESTLGGRFVSAAGSQARTVRICEALRTHIHHRYKCLNKCPLSGGSAQAYAPPRPWRWRCSPTQHRAPLLITPSASFLSTQHFAPRGVTLAAGGKLAALYEPAAESLTASGMPIETAVIELERTEGRARRRTSGPTPKRSRKPPL